MTSHLLKKVSLSVIILNCTFITLTTNYENNELSTIKKVGAAKPAQCRTGMVGNIIAGIAATTFIVVAYKAFCSLQLNNLLNKLPTVHKMIDKHYEEIPDDELQEIYTFLNESYTFATDFQSLPTPQCIISHCKEYYAPIPLYACTTLTKAMHDVGIFKPIFFYQTLVNNHAMHSSFARIGLHPRTLAILNPDYRCSFDRADQTFISQYNFFRTLYHELCHIKGDHGIDFTRILNQAKLDFILKNTELLTSESPEHLPQQMWAVDLLYQNPPENASYVYALFEEMEAELGAIYYMKRIHNYDANANIRYLEDGDHPNNRDQRRYNRKLLKRLKTDPSSDYMIVKELAKEYLLEKEPWFEYFFLRGQPIPSAASLTATSYENTMPVYAILST